MVTSLRRESRNLGLILLDKVAIWISSVVSSWRSESNNISMVLLDKLIFAISKNMPDGHTDGWRGRWTDRHMNRQDCLTPFFIFLTDRQNDQPTDGQYKTYKLSSQSIKKIILYCKNVNIFFEFFCWPFYLLTRLLFIK